jgi:hypothetical protein
MFSDQEQFIHLTGSLFLPCREQKNITKHFNKRVGILKICFELKINLVGLVAFFSTETNSIPPGHLDLTVT